MANFAALARVVALSLLASLAGCVGETETSYTDVGSACVSGDVDAAHTVTVNFETCLSSSCDSVVESGCEASLDGTTLTIHASATVASKSGDCTSDCGQLSVSCETPPLAAGSYTLVYGDAQTSLTVPVGEGEPTCAEVEPS